MTILSAVIAVTMLWIGIGIGAASDEIGLTDEQACDIFRRANRYGEYMDDHIVRIQQLQETIEKGTGIKFEGW